MSRCHRWSFINSSTKKQSVVRQSYIRQELGADAKAIFNVNSAAFDTDAEADLVDRLRKAACPTVSLVAVEVDEANTVGFEPIIGHILFSEVQLDGSAYNAKRGLKIMGLAPMSVRPDRQRSGIGSQLVISGIERCLELGYDAIVVLGHPDYYPKFGFKPSVEFGIKSEYPVPDEVFMIKPLTLTEGAFKACGGIIKYSQAFDSV